MSHHCHRLRVGSFGFALGLAWALGILILGLLAAWFNMGNPLVTLFGSIYMGYDPTFLGSIYGALWGFLDGFIFGVLIAWFYNLCGKCHKKEEG